MSNKFFYFLLLTGVALSVSFFALKLHKYCRSGYGFVGGGLFSAQGRLPREFEYGAASDVKDISYYEGLFSSKELFKILGKEKTPLPEKPQMQINLDEELSKFELLGIVSGGNKSQALIRNVKTGKTFYCTGGEKLDGFVVESVLSDKVIFKRGESTVELNL